MCHVHITQNIFFSFSSCEMYEVHFLIYFFIYHILCRAVGEMYVRQKKYLQAADCFEKEIGIITGITLGNVPEIFPEEVSKNVPGHGHEKVAGNVPEKVEEVDGNVPDATVSDSPNNTGNEKNNTLIKSTENTTIQTADNIKNNKILTPAEKIKIKNLHLLLGSIYATHLSNVAVASRHYDTALDMGAEMNKEIRMFFAKYSKEHSSDLSLEEEHSVTAAAGIADRSGGGGVEGDGSDETGDDGEADKNNSNNSSNTNGDGNNNDNMKSNTYNVISHADHDIIDLDTIINSNGDDKNSEKSSRIDGEKSSEKGRTDVPTPFRDNNGTRRPDHDSAAKSVPRLMERAGFSLNRWVVKNERESVQMSPSEQEDAPKG